MKTDLAKKASVLFSGGTDSTLAAYLIGRRVRQLTLLTFEPKHVLFIENSRRHVQKLAEALPDVEILHEIIPVQKNIRKILMSDLAGDWEKYGFNLTALVCLGCRMAMHAAAVIYNLENEIPVIVDGSIRYQSTVPEQLPSFIRRNREKLWTRYGIRHYSPIYEVPDSDRRLDALGISSKGGLKKQFILFDTQPTCLFGVPADVYARLFYGALSGPAREVDSYEYSTEKYPLVSKVIADHFDGKNPGLDELADRLRMQSEKLSAQWKDVSHD
jgi:predicted subunit of tRNA(5-methylaminomethyl-2-thiouridylate) methyltransferase